MIERRCLGRSESKEGEPVFTCKFCCPLLARAKTKQRPREKARDWEEWAVRGLWAQSCSCVVVSWLSCYLPDNLLKTNIALRWT